MTKFIDPGADQARLLQQEMIRELESGQKPETEEAEEITNSEYRSLFQKIKYTWRPEDQNALVQLRAAADQVIVDIFLAQMRVLDQLYQAARVPLLDSQGEPLLDSKSRVRWEEDQNGQPRENWKQLSMEDLQQCLMGLERVRVETTQRVSELFLEAIFAKHIHTDDWHSAYEKPLEGTQGDRQARANRDSKETKYTAFFRYYLYHRAKTLESELNNLIRYVEKMIEWRIWHKER